MIFYSDILCKILINCSIPLILPQRFVSISSDSFDKDLPSRAFEGNQSRCFQRRTFPFDFSAWFVIGRWELSSIAKNRQSREFETSIPSISIKMACRKPRGWISRKITRLFCFGSATHLRRNDPPTAPNRSKHILLPTNSFMRVNLRWLSLETDNEGCTVIFCDLSRLK